MELNSSGTSKSLQCKLGLPQWQHPHPYAPRHTHTSCWAWYQEHKQIYKRDRWTDTRQDTNYGSRWSDFDRLINRSTWTKTDSLLKRKLNVHAVCKYICGHLKIASTNCLSVKPTNVQTHDTDRGKTNQRKSSVTPSTQTALERAGSGRKRGFETRSKQSSKQSMPAFGHDAEEINGKLDKMWEMCVFAIDSPLWCFLSS